jgi:RHS repeat-associated protein
VCFSQSRYTGKERDTESGNDYFGARYYASSMGRMMSPDPSNIGADPENPQTWNMYSYGLNNPLRLTDPTGLYVCEDSTDCSSQNDKNLAASLAAARDAANNLTGDDKTNALRSVNSYGDMGVDNGVNVRFDANIKGGDAVTEVSGVANGDKSADNPTGQNINVTFKPNSVGTADDPANGAGLVAHEGTHVADGSAWVASGFSSSLNPTTLKTESDANRVQFNVYQSASRNDGAYTSSQMGIPISNKTTFKMIGPDLQKKLAEKYGNAGSQPAFVPKAVLQP